ncbi:MAG: hypothetical protein NTZ27_11895 [Ignavibacteriales bacterium]|nr:hypothetical protein [Ignavibacteriales bacterium]
MFAVAQNRIEIGGYNNRNLLEVWILLSISLAIIASRLSRSRLLFMFPLIFLLMISFIIQVNHRGKAYQYQLKITKDCVEKVSSNKIFTKGDIIVGNIPKFLTENYNNELIFGSPWDWGSAINIYSKGNIGGGIPITSEGYFRKEDPFTAELLDKKKIDVCQDTLIYDDWLKTEINKIWYYEYDIKSGRSQLFKFGSKDNVNKILFEENRSHKINVFTKPFYERIKQPIANFVVKNFLKKETILPGKKK